MASVTGRTCPRCGTRFELPRGRRGTPYAGFCSLACIEAHKVEHAHFRASRLEQDFAERLQDVGLAFVPQYPFGPYVVDLAFPQIRLLVEIDGELYHTTPQGQARDDRKDVLASTEGWRLLRLPEFIVREHPEEAVRTVLEAFDFRSDL